MHMLYVDAYCPIDILKSVTIYSPNNCAFPHFNTHMLTLGFVNLFKICDLKSD